MVGGLAGYMQEMQDKSYQKSQALRENLHQDERLGLQMRQQDMNEQIGMQNVASAKQDMQTQLQDRMIKAYGMINDQVGGLAMIDDPVQYKQGLDHVFSSPIGKALDPSREAYEFFSNQENAKNILPQLQGYSSLQKQGADRQELAMEMAKTQSIIENYTNQMKNRDVSTQINQNKLGIESNRLELENVYKGEKIRQADERLSIDKNKKGTSFSVNPNTGEVTYSTGGSVDAQGNMPLSNSNISKAQEDVIGNQSLLSELDTIEGLFDPSNMTYTGGAYNKVNEFTDKLGAPLDVEKLTKNTQFQNSLAQFFNAYRKEITGAAGPMAELKAIEASIMNKNMGPEQFKAAFAQVKGKTQRALRLKRKLLREGVNVEDKGFGEALSNAYLSDVDDDAKTRAIELRDALSMQVGDKEQLKKLIQESLIKEGYLGRPI